METIRIRDPGSGMEQSRIRDKHPGSATLVATSFVAVWGVFCFVHVTSHGEGAIVKKTSALYNLSKELTRCPSELVQHFRL